MINLLVDSKYLLAADGNYPSTMHFPGIVPKIYTVNKSIAQKFVRYIISGEPAAVFGSDNRIKVDEICPPEFAAAGSLCFLVSEVSVVSGNKAHHDSQITCYFNKSNAFPVRCVNIDELKGPGGGFPIRVYTLSFNAKGNMILVEIYRVVSFNAYTRMGPAARGLFCVLVSEVSEVGWNYGGWRNGCMDA
jgi:hypothetical protein